VDRELWRGETRQARRIEDRDWNRWVSRRAGDERFGERLASWRGQRALPVRVAGAGCPPGLAKQNAFCLPPGQLRRAQMMGRRIDQSRFGPVPQDWLYRFFDNDDFYHRYDDDGFIYRIDRESDFVSAILPLFGTGLTLGEPLPLGYDTYNLPMPYRDLYADSDEHLYRYDDGAIYQVDTETRLIESVVALLSGNPINVGSPLPSGYDAYNLPMDYRDRYSDDADSLYRYSNGGIYEADPQTMLVERLVEMVL
jgi:dipeptidyl aminopeptidase/acylaminoacyl peptidase